MQYVYNVLFITYSAVIPIYPFWYTHILDIYFFINTVLNTAIMILLCQLWNTGWNQKYLGRSTKWNRYDHPPHPVPSPTLDPFFWIAKHFIYQMIQMLILKYATLTVFYFLNFLLLLLFIYLFKFILKVNQHTWIVLL